MRIGFIATRLTGTDGVSLEVEKWAQIFTRQGHDVFYCAGELGGYASGGVLIPQLHFEHQTIYALSKRAFDDEIEDDPDALADEIYGVADEMRMPLRSFIRSNKLDLIIVQNALTIPMNIPLGVCLTGLIAELGIDTIAHHHDFYWERQRYQANEIMDLLDTTFPSKLPSIQHVTINSIAQQRLKARRSIDSIVIPNVFDYANPPNGIDEYNRDVREAIGISQDDTFVLQPTRVIQRKGIEQALVLLHQLDIPDTKLFITHNIKDEGVMYWRWLSREAQVMGIEMHNIKDLVATERGMTNDHKIYSLWDIYPHANLVTYPSTYEGFGNALLESVYFKRLMVVNRYPVYNADIKPLGFRFIEMDGFVDDECVEETRYLLNHPDEVSEFTQMNYEIAREHFSYEVLDKKLHEILISF